MKTIQIILTILASILVGSGLQAQNFKLIGDKSEVIVNGTSTIHDWEISCDEVNGSAEIQLVENQLVGIETLGFQVGVKGMKSGKKIMNDKTYIALREDQFPIINYELSRVQDIQIQKNGTYLIKAEGTLTVAGKKNKISHKVIATISGSAMLFSGEYKLDMTAYAVEPPSALLGTIKTGKNVTVKFNVKFLLINKSKQS